MGERSVLPIYSQIQAILKLEKLPVKIFLTPEKYILTYFEVYDNFEEMKYTILKYFNIPNDYHQLFSFYEVTSYKKFTDETIIEDFVRLSDIQSTFTLNFREK